MTKTLFTGKSAHKFLKQAINKIICGDALAVIKKLPSESIDCVVTSPPYFHLRDFGAKGQIGLENTLEEYLTRLLTVFDEIKRVLKPAGTCWVNLGDTYGNGGVTTYAKASKKQSLSSAKKTKAVSGLSSDSTSDLPSDLTVLAKTVVPQRKTKCLLQVPSRFTLAMTERGWILRNEIIWHKPNCVPSSVKDRLTVDFEKLFFFVKNRKYYFNQQFEPLHNPERLKRRYFKPNSPRKWDYEKDRSAVPVNPASIEKSRKKMLERGRNKRCVWRVPTGQFTGNHFAVFPEKLVETPVLAGCPKDGIVLDPFVGSGTTAIVAKRLGRRFIGVELNSAYAKMAKRRMGTLDL